MIFVTVGTHEQQFNRLIKEVDMLKKKGVIKEGVFIQRGYSDYIPTSCDYENILTYHQMESYLDNARIIITHGGPASFMKALERKKIPIVVPRKIEYSEHVNNHQSDFVHKMNKNNNKVLIVDDIVDLENTIINYETLSKKNKDVSQSNNSEFVKQFESIVFKLVGKEQ